MALASCVMRRVLVDHARTRNSIKRGGEEERVPLDGNVDVAVEDLRLELLDLDRALTAMAKKMPEGVEVVEMRYFGGMTAEETAEAVGRSVHVVRHELRLAQAWLRRELSV